MGKNYFEKKILLFNKKIKDNLYKYQGKNDIDDIDNYKKLILLSDPEFKVLFVNRIMSNIIHVLYHSQRRVFTNAITLYRGCDIYKDIKLINFMSFSYDIDVAKEFIKNCLIKLHIRPESKVILTAGCSHSVYKYQYEIIIPCYSKIKIIHEYEDYQVQSLSHDMNAQDYKNFMTLKKICQIKKLNYKEESIKKLQLYLQHKTLYQRLFTNVTSDIGYKYLIPSHRILQIYTISLQL
jgi:hypothetical protein